MGFLRKVLGGREKPGMVLNVNYFNRIRDDAALQVVGEAYRQGNVALARPPNAADLPPGIPPPPPGYFKAALIPMPENEYDSNAIGVLLWAGGDWVLSGYLSRTDAIAYQPVFVHIAKQSASRPAIACDAALVSERDGKGVVLHLGTPGECAAELVTDDRTPAAHQWAGRMVAVTGWGATTVYGIPLDRAGQVTLIQWAGCDLMPRLTKKTTALIVASQNDVTGNLQRAKEYGIETVQEPEFLVAIGLPSDAIGRVSGRWARG